MVAQYAVEVDVPEGKALVRDAALAWDFYVIEEGSAEVRRGQKTLGTLGAGDFFGEIGVLASDRRRTASVVATSPMKAIRLTTHQLRMIADSCPRSQSVCAPRSPSASNVSSSSSRRAVRADEQSGNCVDRFGEVVGRV